MQTFFSIVGLAWTTSSMDGIELLTSRFVTNVS
jgi:hypothetical protein